MNLCDDMLYEVSKWLLPADWLCFTHTNRRIFNLMETDRPFQLQTRKGLRENIIECYSSITF